jgi:peptidoglycan/xylan/chitin deacetylase (PgdA/CDA1 family)|tara:strand:- start:22 stop:981 length:960 start_codon:yes stop_codon:yes gene_type:complete
MFHSVGSIKNNDCLTLAGMRVSVKNFNDQMKYISENYNTIHLRDLFLWQSGINKIPSRPCVISFDDGLSDVYNNAVPILRQYRLKATLFIIGNSLVNEKPSWLHEIYEILDSFSLSSCIDVFKHIIPSFRQDMEVNKESVRRGIKEYFLSLDRLTRLRLLRNIKNEYGGKLIRKPIYFMNAEQIIELSSMGFEIGSHSFYHERLSTLSLNKINEELKKSKIIIEESINTRCESFSYPYGGYSSFDDRVVGSLKRNGYYCACSTIDGVNYRNTNKFKLRRWFVKDKPVNYLTSKFGELKKPRNRLRSMVKYIAKKGLQYE